MLWQPFPFYDVLWDDPWLFWIGTTNVENVESGTPSLYQALKWIIVVYLPFSCLRAGLTLVEFKGTSDNELDKSQRFLKIDWTKRKSVWKKICRKCLSCSSGARTKLFRGGGRWLGPFTELRMRLLGPWVGGLCEIGGIRAGQSLPALPAQPAAHCVPVALQSWRGSRGRHKQINPWVIAWVHSQWLYSCRTAFILFHVSHEKNNNTNVCLHCIRVCPCRTRISIEGMLNAFFFNSLHLFFHTRVWLC